MRATLAIALLLIVIACLITSTTTTRATDQSFTDPYSIAFVKSEIAYVRRGFYNTADDKKHLQQLMSLGDAISIAFLKIYTQQELLQADNTMAHLVLARNAFSSRGSVHEASDVEPKVTLFVLEFLKEKTSDLSFEKNIEYLQGCVGSFTCSSLGEVEFMKAH